MEFQDVLDQLTNLEQLTYWHWFVFAALLLSFEMLVPGVLFMWLSIAAVATGLILLAFPEMGWETQFLAFAVLSIASVVSGRAWVKSHPTPSDQPNLNIRGAQYVGRSFVLDEAIENGTGKLVVDDTMWKIAGDDVPAGARVRVTGMDGQTLTVEMEGADEKEGEGEGEG